MIATAVLHNIARQMNNPGPPIDLDIVQLIDALENRDLIVIPDNARTDIARRLLIDTYFRFVIFIKSYNINEEQCE